MSGHHHSVFPEDVYYEISSHIPAGSWCNWVRTCKHFLTYNTEEEIRSRRNELLTLLDKMPGEKWFWFGVSANPNVPLSYMKAHPEKPWDWDAYLSNPSIDDEYLDQYLKDHKKWDCKVFKNPKFTLDRLEGYDRMTMASWNYLSQNPNLTMSFVEAHLYAPWAWVHISRHPNLTTSFVEKYPDKLEWSMVSMNPVISLTFIEQHPTFPWERNGLSKNPHITPAFVMKHPEMCWNWASLNCHPNFPLSFFEKGGAGADKRYPMWASFHPDLTLEYIEEHTELRVFYRYLVRSHNIPIRKLIPYLDSKGVSYEMRKLSGNPTLTSDIVLQYPEKHWNFGTLSRNTFGR